MPNLSTADPRFYFPTHNNQELNCPECKVRFKAFTGRAFLTEYTVKEEERREVLIFHDYLCYLLWCHPRFQCGQA
jgi:hypothetical protein